MHVRSWSWFLVEVDRHGPNEWPTPSWASLQIDQLWNIEEPNVWSRACLTQHYNTGSVLTSSSFPSSQRTTRAFTFCMCV